MKHILYIGEGCHDCNIVEEFIRSNNLDIEIVDIDQDPQRVPFEVFIRPALTQNDVLVGYGIDVIEYIRKQILQK